MPPSGRDSPALSSKSNASEASSLDSNLDRILIVPIVDGIAAPPLVDNPYSDENVSNASSKKSSVAQTSLPFLHPYSGSAQSSSGGTRLPNPPSLVSFKQMRFLIMDAPSETNLHLYIKEMEKYCVTDVVRVCDPSYSREIVERHGIKVHEFSFADGEAPPEPVIAYWLNLVGSRFQNNPTDADTPDDHRGVTIAIHCVAGLGRAPVLVAIALMEAGMSAFDAISYIRERRRGAINTRQLKFLETYRRRGKSSSNKCCIM